MSKKTSIYLSDQAEFIIGPLLQHESLSSRVLSCLDRFNTMVESERERLKFSMDEEDWWVLQDVYSTWPSKEASGGIIVRKFIEYAESCDIPDTLPRLKDLPVNTAIALIEILESEFRKTKFGKRSVKERIARLFGDEEMNALKRIYKAAATKTSPITNGVFLTEIESAADFDPKLKGLLEKIYNLPASSLGVVIRILNSK